MRAPWLIEMHVRIDHAGKHVESLGVDHLFARSCKVWLDGDDATIGNGEICVTDTRRGNQRAVTHDEVVETHRQTYLTFQTEGAETAPAP